MPNFIDRRSTALLTVILSLSAGTVQAAEITAVAQPSGQVVTPEADLQTVCWQNGNKIFEREELSGIDLGSVLREQTLSLKKTGQSGTDTIIVPLGRTVCIISPSG